MKKKAKVETLGCQFEIKQLDESGTFEGWLSVFGKLDEGGDIVEKGAFTKTLKEAGGEFPLLWQHDHKLPIGSFQAEQKDQGLWVVGKLLIDEVRQAREAYALMKARVVKGLSIGFSTVRDEIKNGIRLLKEVKLREGSVVTFPMLPAAQVVSVKSDDQKDFADSLQRRQLFAAPDQMLEALWGVLDSLLWWSDLDAEEALEAARESIEQFQSAYLGMLPGLLEMIKSHPEFEEKIAHRDLVRAVKVVERIASRMKSFDAVVTSDDADSTEDSAAVTESKADDTSEDEAAAVLLRVADKLKSGGRAA